MRKTKTDLVSNMIKKALCSGQRVSNAFTVFTVVDAHALLNGGLSIIKYHPLMVTRVDCVVFVFVPDLTLISSKNKNKITYCCVKPKTVNCTFDQN